MKIITIGDCPLGGKPKSEEEENEENIFQERRIYAKA
jgi:hypothetical protein